MTIKEQKQKIRDEMRRLRHSFGQNFREDASRRITVGVLSLPEVQSARMFFVYVSMTDEVSTHALIRTLLGQRKVVAIPFVTDDGRMIQRHLTHWAQLTKDRRGFLTVPYGDVLHESPEICITPGLAFCPNGTRLGSGGGHFDRYFQRHRSAWRIALAHEAQLVPVLPVEAHDRKIHVIVTEQRIRVCAARA